jgi:hypothetical protein
MPEAVHICKYNLLGEPTNSKDQSPVQKLMVAQQVKLSPFMEFRDALLFSQEPISGLCP